MLYSRKGTLMSYVTLHAEGISQPLCIRENTLDRYVFDEIFLRGQYAVDPSALRKYAALKEVTLKEPEIIFDLGANIGLSAVYFAEHYPNARILSVEPDQENYELLLSNTQPYPNITPMLGAVWDIREPVSIANRDQIVTRSGKLNKSSYMVDSGIRPGEAAVPGCPIPWLLDHFGADRIDLCKIDIQGAEKRLFSADTGWLAKTTYLFVEVHDRFVDGCFHAVAAAVREYGFVYIGASGRDGDMLFFVNGAAL